MQKENTNLVDVSRLYTLRSFSEKFKIPYGTVYGKYNTSASGRARKPYDIRNVSGIDMIYVSPEFEKELFEKFSKK